ANINDFLNHSNNSTFESVHTSQSEDEDYEVEESDENEEMEEVERDFQLTSDKKRRKITVDFIDTAPKKKKKLNKDLYKPPTVEELNQLRETENLFHSNLFRLQIEEMLNEVRIKDKYKRLFDAWYKSFEKTIESIPQTEQYELSDEKLKEGLNVNIPMPNVPKGTKGVFKFLKPSYVAIIGSYVYDTAISPNITVDVMIEMPAKMFQNQDHKNYRYMKKKAIYLAYIASNITDDIAEHKKFIGDNLRPVLKIVPTGQLGTKINVLVHLSVQQESFKLNKFLPEKNNINPGWFFKKTKDDDSPATPHYNSIILHDLIMRKHSEDMKVIKEYPNLRDGIILLKIWLGQRELIKGHATFNGYTITMFILYLLSIKTLNTFMSSYQVVRNVWSYLVQVDWCETGVTMNPDNNSEKRILSYHNYYDCIFLDSTGYYNITAFVSKATYKWIQKEAELSLNLLDSAHADSFQSLFMKKISFYVAFDHLIWFKNIEGLKQMVDTKSSSKDKLDYGPNYQAQAIKILYNILNKGLTNRVHQICVLPNDVMEWECTEDNCNNIGNIMIGLELNPKFCYSMVDKGPEANLPEAIEFRNFWGKRSNLRRFQDGSIREAVVWSDGKTVAGKRKTVKKIVKFVLKEKLGHRVFRSFYVADEMENLLRRQKVVLMGVTYGTGEEAARKVLNVFDTLEKDLMSLSDIPLSIHGVQGSSAVFRYTDVFPPLATHLVRSRQIYKSDDINSDDISSDDISSDDICLKLQQSLPKAPKYYPPLEVSLQLSTSGKWPDELEAFRKTKAAFHLQIAECLRKQCKIKAHANDSYIDVYKDGFTFRLRVAHQKEIGYLKQQVSEDGVIKYKDNDESIELENKLFELPKLTSALRGLHSQQPSFGPACALTKRWLSAQLLDDSHIPDIVVELLMASMYLTPSAYRPTSTPQVAFLRLLETFARGHWYTDPVIVNFNSEMSRKEILDVETLFGTARDSLPPLFISTPYDQQRSLWTRKAPSLLILNRITALAKVFLQLYEEHRFARTSLMIKFLFKPPLTEYDCVIYLNPRMVPRITEAVESPATLVEKWHPYRKEQHERIPAVGFDPVQYLLRDLRDGYGEFALFFHDTYGGTVIGVLLKPSALDPKDFKVSNMYGRKYINGKLILNFSAMIQDFSALGKGIIEKIDVRTKLFS
ncbi:Nucleolar protein 6, partial [Habropoda laboriosa]